MKTYTETSYELHVKGRLWQGCKSAAAYRVHATHDMPKNLAEAKDRAGDFEFISSAHVVKTTRKISVTTKKTKLK